MIGVFANVSNFRTLTLVFIRAGGEEDAQSGLEVGGPAGRVGEAEVDAVGEHEGARPRVQDVLGRREHLDQSEMRTETCGGQ